METPSSTLYRTGFGLKKEVQGALASDYYHSDLVNRIKQGGYALVQGRITIRLAQEFGFCYGVDKAVDFAYETRRQFPDRRIFLTTEIIHNPLVNSRLKEMGIEFLSGQYPRNFEDIPVGTIFWKLQSGNIMAPYKFSGHHEKTMPKCGESERLPVFW